MAQKETVLLVEDEVDFAEVLSEFLTEQGIMVTVAHSVKDAIAKMKNKKYKCLVTDIRLGTESGEAVIAYTREKKSGMVFGVPVIVMSGFLDKDLVARIKNDIHAALVKPFEPQLLVDKIKSIK